MSITEQLCSLPKTLPDGGLALYAWPVSSTGIFARSIKSNYRELGIICKGRKSFENQVSQFLLLKDRLVCNTVCRRCTFACACMSVWACGCMCTAYAFEEKELALVRQP